MTSPFCPSMAPFFAPHPSRPASGSVVSRGTNSELRDTRGRGQPYVCARLTVREPPARCERENLERVVCRQVYGDYVITRALYRTIRYPTRFQPSINILERACTHGSTSANKNTCAYNSLLCLPSPLKSSLRNGSRPRAECVRADEERGSYRLEGETRPEGGALPS